MLFFCWNWHHWLIANTVSEAWYLQKINSPESHPRHLMNYKRKNNNPLAMPMLHNLALSNFWMRRWEVKRVQVISTKANCKNLANINFSSCGMQDEETTPQMQSDLEWVAWFIATYFQCKQCTSMWCLGPRAWVKNILFLSLVCRYLSSTCFDYDINSLTSQILVSLRYILHGRNCYALLWYLRSSRFKGRWTSRNKLVMMTSVYPIFIYDPGFKL